MEDRIQGAVAGSLAAKGWTRVDSSGDATIAAVGTTANQPTPTTFYDGFPGWRWRSWDVTATTTVDYKRVGTLVVDVFDSGDKKLLWRGVAQDTLSSKPDNNDKKLDEAVEKSSRTFLPKPRAKSSNAIARGPDQSRWL